MIPQLNSTQPFKWVQTVTLLMPNTMDLQFPFTTITSLSLLLFFLFKLVLVLRRSATTNLPPGPWKLPIIGSIHHLAGSGLPHHALRSLSKRYGPLMHLQLGEISTIVISSPTMAKQVMKTHDLAFASRPVIVASKIVLYDNCDIAFAPYGPYWRQMRKICILEMLSVKNVRSFASIREDEVMKLVTSMKSFLGVPVNVTEKIYTLLSLVTSRAAFGKQCEDNDAFVQVAKEGVLLVGGFDLCDLFPSVKILNLISRHREKLQDVHRRFDVILEKIITQHKEKMSSTGRGSGESEEEDLVDVLLRHQSSDDLQCPITNDHIKAIIQDMFGAGTDTSSTTIEWAMSEMMRNPKVMDKAQAEVRQALKGKKIIHESDIQDLKYLKWVIKETFRLHPPLPLLVPRESRAECSIEGYNIPVGTKVIINAWAIGRDPDHWEDAESFVPERFNGSSVDFIGTDFQYIPFGAGRRICPGMSFGVANIEFPLAQLLHNFNWELPNGMKREDLDMSETFGITAARKNNLFLVATPYDPS